MSEKDIQLFYRLIGRLLFTSKVTISEVKTCVTYILIKMELSTNYHNGRQWKTLEYRYILCEEDTNVCIVTYRRSMYTF